MCGRARCTLRAHDIPRASYRTDGSVRHVNMDRYNPSYNVGPGMNLPVLRGDDGSNVSGGGVVLHCMKWGLIPSFTKKTDKPDFYRMFNARSESVGEKASFRRLLPKNRCLVAVEGFYEWKKDGSKKQPYYIHFKDGRPLVFAALYDCWENSEGEKVYTFTILTTSSSQALQWLHDRMPVILGDKQSTDTWLSGSKSDKLLKPYVNSDLVWYPVTPAIGKLSFEGLDCVKEVPLKTQEKNPISKFFATREVKKEQESNMEQSLCGESVKNNLQKNMEEETESTENEGIPSTKTEEHDSKCNALIPASKDAMKCQTKRGYEEISADIKPVKEEIQKSPARKKGIMKSGDDKQPTLFSYFGKK